MTARVGAYGVTIPAGECGHYWADEGGEWMCHRYAEHDGDHSPYRDGQTKSVANTDALRLRPPVDLIHYIMDLENLVRWLALTFSYEDQETGEVVVNDPIWTVWDERGTHLPAAEKLQATWDKVMHDG